MAVIISSKSRGKSVFSCPEVMDSIKNLDPNDPEFIKALRKRNKKTEAEFEDLKRRERVAEQRMALNRWIPIKEKD